jgi:hypothetical protein
MSGVLQLILPGKSAAAAYTGPGDIVASAKAFWGLRAYNAASIGNNCCDIKRASDSTTQTFVTVSGGLVDKASIATFLTSTTGTITKWYDQTGNGFDVAGDGARQLPPIGLNVLGTNPAAQPVSASPNDLLVTSSTITQAQPFTVSMVCNRTTVGGGDCIWLNDAPSIFVQAQTANTWRMFAGSALGSITVNDNATNALNCVFNGASSDFNVNGTAHTGDAGSGGLSGAKMFIFSNPAFPWIGNCFEIGLWPSAFSGTNSTNMSANQHTFWGF